jgi:serine/threonine-protein kinase RsbW
MVTQQTTNPCDAALPDGRWSRRTLGKRGDAEPLLADFRAAMSAAGYTDEDVFGMALAVEEAVANGFDHGTRGDATKEVRVGYQVGPQRVLVEVEDDGEGFAPREVADPLAEEHLDCPDGRGLLLMREFTTWMRHNDSGNRVTLCKERAAG